MGQETRFCRSNVIKKEAASIISLENKTFALLCLLIDTGFITCFSGVCSSQLIADLMPDVSVLETIDKYELIQWVPLATQICQALIVIN